MALCVVLLVGGGLLIRSLRNLQKVPLGMRMEGLVRVGVNPKAHIPMQKELLFIRNWCAGCASSLEWTR